LTPPVSSLAAAAYRVPTDAPESDGTFQWNATTIVVARAAAGGSSGLGYSYTDASAAGLVGGMLAEAVVGRSAFDVEGAWEAMVGAVRNVGRSGISAMAISAADAALWDLKGRLLGLPVAALLGAVRPRVPVYGSGGFTSYSEAELAEQLAGWVESGIPRVKMKVGRRPEDDPSRVAAARRAIGEEAELYVDANGAYERKPALALAARFAESGVSWFEEPVDARDIDGLRLVRDRAPASMEIAVGEYGFVLSDFRRIIDAGAADVVQADATRCAGITGFRKTVVLCREARLPLSSHCAPALHVHPGCAAGPLRHLEYFHDHVRIESMLFDGPARPVDGSLAPDWSRPGLGIELKTRDAERYAL
jgi:L-alanine-DL-glutamate epimerase-like enolase superfamily enzyme